MKKKIPAKLIPIPEFENYVFDTSDAKLKKKVKGEWIALKPLSYFIETTWRLSKNNYKVNITLSALLYSIREQF